MQDWTATVHGEHSEQEVLRVERLLELNHVEYTHIEEKNPDTVRVELTPSGGGQTVIVNGFDLGELTAHLKLNTYTKKDSYDLVVVGSGPAGMSAALNAKTLFGWTTLIVEDNAPGGAAGTALNPINNYLGIPAGTKALDLAHTWMGQINAAGVEWLPGCRATAITQIEDPRKTGTEDSSLYPTYKLAIQRTDGKGPVDLYAGMVLIAAGLKPNRLGCTGEEQYLGRGVYYGTLPTDIARARKERVIGIVGAGDTASVAAILLAEEKAKDPAQRLQVAMFVRGKFGKDTIPGNVDRVREYVDRQFITVHEGTEVFSCLGKDRKLTGVEFGKTGHPESVEPLDLTALYVLTGGVADTQWLQGIGLRIVSDEDVKQRRYRKAGAVITGGIDSKLGSLTTTGADAIFAAGDVREGAVRRIAAAVGEGGAASLDMNAYLVTDGTWQTAIKEGTALYKYYEATAPRNLGSVAVLGGDALAP
ncbi:NAD(P)/FAD-dependent oxidoreductase [Streptomyces sp. NBC_01237]|uniref:NAD(P)/FAD-dependent oxidoreductase n=1 Tax=Streptomyces sp. NBC_01237 TaxID=2903790 RepID=UPI002DD982CC|nr:NAD(P)/FAD-dependent oxidoreductase [Streptomyces sp. NBC_01237]WRZ70514.1 NAD(P)/FAD-dependent oxidoreductase [Streptomyces sp. NBC_01237]